MSFPVDTNPAEHLTAYHRESSIHYLLDTHVAVVLQPTHVGSTIHPSTNTRVNLLKVVCKEQRRTSKTNSFTVWV